MAKEPKYVVEERQKRDKLYRHYASIAPPPDKVSDLLGVSLQEAADGLRRAKRAAPKPEHAPAPQGALC